jgi:hypothetical protein
MNDVAVQYSEYGAVRQEISPKEFSVTPINFPSISRSSFARLDGSTAAIPLLNALKLRGNVRRDYLICMDASEPHSLPTP